MTTAIDRLDFMRQLILLCLPFLLFSCHTNRQVQSEYIYVHDTDSVQTIKWRVDSIYSSEKVNTYTRNDTVFSEREVIKYKERNSSDTLRLVKTVTITQKLYYTKIKEVNRLKWWQTALCWIGGAAIIATTAWVTIRLKRHTG